MKLDTLELSATITGNECPKTMTTYSYLWADGGAVEEAGLGIRQVTIEGVVSGAANRDALEQAFEASGEKKLYFPSANGASDDRYYKVKTPPVRCTPVTATLYRYSVTVLCEDPRQYYTADDTVVW